LDGDSRASAVEPPWKHVVELSSQRSQLLLQDRNITLNWLTVGLFGGLIGLLTREGRIFGLILGLSIGLLFELSGSLNRGGSAVIKHYTLH
jgi:hypothetical protein